MKIARVRETRSLMLSALFLTLATGGSAQGGGSRRFLGEEGTSFGKPFSYEPSNDARSKRKTNLN